MKNHPHDPEDRVDLDPTTEIVGSILFLVLLFGGLYLAAFVL